MGEIPFDGKIQIDHGSLIGYFAQNQASLLDEELTVFQTIDYVAVGDIEPRSKMMMMIFGAGSICGGEAIEKKVKEPVGW